MGCFSEPLSIGTSGFHYTLTCDLSLQAFWRGYRVRKRLKKGKKGKGKKGKKGGVKKGGKSPKGSPKGKKGKGKK